MQQYYRAQEQAQRQAAAQAQAQSQAADPRTRQAEPYEASIRPPSYATRAPGTPAGWDPVKEFGAMNQARLSFDTWLTTYRPAKATRRASHSHLKPMPRPMRSPTWLKHR